jgi:hypothetical protein
VASQLESSVRCIGCDKRWRCVGEREKREELVCLLTLCVPLLCRTHPQHFSVLARTSLASQISPSFKHTVPPILMDDYLNLVTSLGKILLANSRTLLPEYGQSFGQYQQPCPEPASALLHPSSDYAFGSIGHGDWGYNGTSSVLPFTDYSSHFGIHPAQFGGLYNHYDQVPRSG